MHSLRTCMLCLNHRDELDKSTLDLNSRQKMIDRCFSHRDEFDSTVQIGMLYIALASFIYTQDT